MVNNGLLINFGAYIASTNTYPLAYTSFVRCITGGEYSFGGTDNRLLSTTLTTFNCARSHSNACTHYIAIGT